MLVLKRKKGQAIEIGSDITIMVTDAGPGWASIGIDAPANVPICREELLPEVKDNIEQRVKGLRIVAA